MRQQRQRQQSLFGPHPTTDSDVLATFDQKGEILTRKEIAERLGRKKTPSLIDRIERMVKEGKLERDSVPQPNGVPCLYYRLSATEGTRGNE